VQINSDGDEYMRNGIRILKRVNAIQAKSPSSIAVFPIPDCVRIDNGVGEPPNIVNALGVR
jgi:hypothetical protein